MLNVNKRLPQHNKVKTSQDSGLSEIKVWTSSPNTESQLICWMRKREPRPWGVTSSSWRNEFFTVFHPKDTSLDNRPQIKEPFWKSTSPVEKFQHNTTGAKKSEIRCIKEDMKNSFTLPVSPLPQGGIAQCHQTPWLVIYPMGESESLRVSAWLPKLCGSLSK